MEIKIGQLYKPTFDSNVKAFDIVRIDEENGLVHTKVYTKEGEPFDDSIEIETLKNAVEIGEYELICNRYQDVHQENQTFTISRPYYYYDWCKPQASEKPRFDGKMCGRCRNRFGGSSKQMNYCSQHCNNETCQRFKLDR